MASGPDMQRMYGGYVPLPSPTYTTTNYSWTLEQRVKELENRIADIEALLAEEDPDGVTATAVEAPRAVLHLAFSRKEFAELAARAEKAGMSISEYVKNAELRVRSNGL